MSRQTTETLFAQWKAVKLLGPPVRFALDRTEVCCNHHPYIAQRFLVHPSAVIFNGD